MQEEFSDHILYDYVHNKCKLSWFMHKTNCTLDLQKEQTYTLSVAIGSIAVYYEPVVGLMDLPFTRGDSTAS